MFEIQHSTIAIYQMEILLSRVKTFLRSHLFEKEKKYESILYELEKKNEKLKKAREVAEAQAQDLIRYTRELEQFAYVATHDLRAPVVNLDGLVKVYRNRGHVDPG